MAGWKEEKSQNGKKEKNPRLLSQFRRQFLSSLSSPHNMHFMLSFQGAELGLKIKLQGIRAPEKYSFMCFY